jgi:hypothetical protein
MAMEVWFGGIEHAEGCDGLSVVLPEEPGNPFLSVRLFGLWQILEKSLVDVVLFSGMVSLASL